MKTATDTVAGFFKTRDTAQFAVWDLINCGFSKGDMCIRTTQVERHFWGDEGETVVVKAAARRMPDDEGSRELVYETTQVPMGPGDMPALVKLGIPEAQARFFFDGMRRGGYVVTVDARGLRAEEAEEILRRHGAVDREERSSERRGERLAAIEEMFAQSGEAAPTRVTPVTEPLTHASLQEQLARARVFDADSVVPGAQLRREADVSAMDDDEFERHFRATYGTMGERFDEPYRSAYRFAESESASHPQFANKEWNEVEEDIHRDWERSHPGTWNRVEGAIHFGWNRARRH